MIGGLFHSPLTSQPQNPDPVQSGEINTALGKCCWAVSGARDRDCSLEEALGRAGAIREGFQERVWLGLHPFPQPTTLHGFLLILTVHLSHTATGNPWVLPMRGLWAT